MCSSLPARLMGEFQASKVYLQYATRLTGKFPSRGISRHFWPVWVRPRDKIQTFSGGREGHRNMGVAKRLIYPFRGWGSFWQKNLCQIFYTSNPNRHPQLYSSKQHFPSLDILLLPNSHPAKIGPKNICFFRNRSIGCP